MANPYSTGGGGVHFESCVVAYYLAATLAGERARGVPGLHVTQVLTQREHFGEPLDDIIVNGILEDGSPTKLSLQVKSTLTFTENDGEWKAVLGKAWTTFTSRTFNATHNRLGVAIGTYSTRADKYYQTVLRWATYSCNGQNFVQRITQERFSHKERQAFVTATRDILSIHAGTTVDEDTLWRFLKVFRILYFDFNIAESSRDVVQALTLISHCLPPEQRGQAKAIWSHLIAEAGNITPTGGGASRESLAESLQNAGLPSGSGATSWRDIRSIDQESRRALLWIVHTPWAKDRALCREKLDQIEQSSCIEEFIPPGMEDRAAPTRTNFLGQWALTHVWHMDGRTLSSHSLLAQHMGMVHTLIKDPDSRSILKKAEEMKLIHGLHGHFHDKAFAIALAADHVASWFTIEPNTGDVVMQWMLGNLYELSGQNVGYCEEKVSKDKSGHEHPLMQLLGLLLLWWEGSEHSRAAWEGKSLPLDPTAFSHQERRRILYNLRTYDRLVQELGITICTGTVMDPLSIRWIYKADLTGCIASALEFLGEENISVYYRHLDRVDDAAKPNIMRSIVRLINRLENIESFCGGTYAPVIRACSRHASLADLERVKEHRELLKKCLTVLSVPTGTVLNEHQLTFLIDLYSCGQSQRKGEHLRGLAGRCLAANGNLTVVWTRIDNSDLRAAWVREIDVHSMDPLKLQSLIQHMEIAGTDSLGVRQVLGSLKKRLKDGMSHIKDEARRI